VLGPVIDGLCQERCPTIAGVVDGAWPLLRHTLASPRLTQAQVLDAAQRAAGRMRVVVARQGAAEMLDAGSFDEPDDDGAGASSACSSANSTGKGGGGGGGESRFTRAAAAACQQLASKQEQWRAKVTEEALGELARKVRSAAAAAAVQQQHMACTCQQHSTACTHTQHSLC
jgi:hypothetical protein